MSTKTKRISVQNLQEGMILAADAVTPNGQMLIPVGTVITENHLFRLNLYQILSAVIYEESDKVSEEDILIDTPLDTIAEDDITSDTDARPIRNEAFLRFNQVYTKVDKIIRAQFEDILEGKPVDQNKLLGTSDALLKSVRVKSDLFNYMHHVRSEDYHTYVHAINVSVLCSIFGHWMKMPKESIDALVVAGLIHDIGKIKIPVDLLNKSTPLSDEEFDQIRQHALLGYEMVKDLDLSDDIKQTVLLHHERNDGSGYPYGYTREEIPEFAKIVAILDIYDAMTTHRSYHAKFSPFKVIQIFEQESYGHLDTKYLFTFLENIAHYYLGEEVRLTDGTKGKIVFIHNQSPSRPIIQSGDQMIDLLTTKDLKIEEIL